MWSLECMKKGTKYDFLVGEDYIVGRKDCYILISGDSSISRKHALLTIQHPDNNLNRPSSPSGLVLKDTSKYGSFVNGSKLATGIETRLKEGDQIKFGTIDTNEMKVKYRPLVVAASALQAPEKRQMKQTVHKLGGHVVSEWCPECSHLIMSQLNVTVKVISALVACRPIVTPDFLNRTVEAVKTKSALPTSEAFLPPIVEPAINKKDVSFCPNDRRKDIFKGKTFYFLTQKQYKRLHIPIATAGGRSELLDEDSDIARLRGQLVSEGACVLYTEHQDSTQPLSQMGQDMIGDVLTILKKHGRRPIPESELGLAVLYVSTALHCNPVVAQAGLNLLSAVPSQSLPTQNVLALDTQSHSPQIHGRGGGSSRKGQAGIAGEAGATSNQQQKNLSSTPKISKISETILEASSTSKSASTSRSLDASPEFSLPGKVKARTETQLSMKRESQNTQQRERRERSPDLVKEQEQAAKAVTNVDRRAEKQDTHQVKVKEEKISQMVPEEDEEEEDVAANLFEVGFSRTTSQKRRAQVSQSLQLASNSTKEQEKRKQTTLHSFKKPKSEAEGTKKDSNSRRTEEAVGTSSLQMKEEPMDMAETEQDPGEQVIQSLHEEAEGNNDGGEREERRTEDWKRSGKRKASKMRDDDDDEEDVGERRADNRGQTSRPKTEEDAGSSMWKKKPRIDVFSQDDDAEMESERRDEEDRSRRGLPDTDSDLHGGFISARVPIEDQIHVKIDRDYEKEEGVPSNLMVVKNAAVIIRKERKQQRSTVPVIGKNGRPVKNFKKFRKANYAGQERIPQIIGGRDLFAHHNNPSKDIEEMFNEEVRADKKRDKQEEIADRLFAYEPKRAPMAKRKR